MTHPSVTASRPAVELHALEKSFGHVHAVRGIDVSIAAGQTVALLGPNGAGKSTTIDMVLGLTRPDRGGVSIFGVTPGEAIERGLVGVMLQTGSLIRDLSVRELLTMMASLYPAPLDVDEVLDLVGVRDVADRRTQKLSGGQAQRVRFAVALVSNPDLLVLDEPTVAMDVEGRRGFWATMRRLTGGGKTVVFATHYLEEADAYADRIVLMSKGKVVADGATTEIRAMVSVRTIRATLGGVDLEALRALPGVSGAERHGDAVSLLCTDSDVAIRALLERFPSAHHIEIAGAGIEAAFLQLTGDPATEAPDATAPEAQHASAMEVGR
ncbi:MAG TPA: ABC transporter ATP-binding protein [Acidimicrobiales bacterium]|nr:ABC transporter ATP-binding protein [Acidimicrobiales bacterium]